MAYQPSKRRKGQDLDLELDIKPVMNLMVVLIPLLLAGVEYVKLSIVEIDLPPTQAGGGMTQNDQKPEKEKEKRLNLSIAITEKGFTITSAAAVLSGESGEGPTIPLTENNEYDYAKLTEKLTEIKKAILENGFKDKDSAIITASSVIEYQVIISVMDAIQSYNDEEGNVMPLFPQINFGQIIV
jgi:biopolymer transport protein ExbD